MKVKVWLEHTSQPVEFENVTNAYQKGDFYCVYREHMNSTMKFPIAHIFRVEETYK